MTRVVGNMMSTDIGDMTLGGLGFQLVWCQPWHATLKNKWMEKASFAFRHLLGCACLKNSGEIQRPTALRRYCSGGWGERR